MHFYFFLNTRTVYTYIYIDMYRGIFIYLNMYMHRFYIECVCLYVEITFKCLNHKPTTTTKIIKKIPKRHDDEEGMNIYFLYGVCVSSVVFG